MELDDFKDLVQFPNGELNAPYILANANLLLKGGEPDLASSLFNLVKNHKKFSHCAYYGLGRCFLCTHQPRKATEAFEKALAFVRRSYIAEALLEALIACEEYSLAEKKALQYACEFSNDRDFVARFRNRYSESLDKRHR